jgi:hypothetical protein
MCRESPQGPATLPVRVGDRASGVVTVVSTPCRAAVRDATRPPLSSHRPWRDRLLRVAATLLSGALAVGVAGCQGDALTSLPSGGAVASGGSTAERMGLPAPSTSSATAVPASGPTDQRTGPALAALATLAVKGRAPRTGYDRARFGQAWADVDRNGCDTRNDVLRRDLTGFVLKAGTHGCLVLRGTLSDPYTGTTIAFLRGQQTSTAVQIDHVVALSDAWQKGASQWSADTRERFANDPLNLLAVDGPSNARKSDGDAATWLPPAKAYRCRYVARQVAVKTAYGLWVTSAERAAITRVLDACPGQPLPTAGAIALGGGPERSVSSPSPTTAPQAGSDAASRLAGTSTYYENCTAVRAAGADPIRAGDPGYARHLDRDGDGVGCE